ncbi:hypothetical protein GQ44DRAFT_717186 [Phaeosphaeriaceae sp. PMI808]|nr:hypothetical protein GQ44DRAFT_717186 [Phaeosphaeriaceae sp. PMI808]
MVSLEAVLASNAQIPTSLPKNLVAIFAGATSGIGEITLKTLAKYTVEPRIYLLARNQASAERVIAECRQINSRGDYIFVRVDLSSIKETDHACEQIQSAERSVNLVFLSAGELRFDRNLTSEGLNTFLAASTYTRIRIVQQILPLLTASASSDQLARVVDVAGGTYEGEINTSDLAALNIPFTQLRSQLSSMHTLALETLAQRAPTVSFVHDFPGSVYTGLGASIVTPLSLLFRPIKTISYMFLGRWLFVPIEESGERHVFFATSMIFKSRDGNSKGVPVRGLEIANGSDGVRGSGTYSINWDGEQRAAQDKTALVNLRKTGGKEMVWNHFTTEFDRITSRV